MPTVLMALGTNKFYVPQPNLQTETPGFQTIQRDSSYNWIPQGRLNKPMAMQFTGPGEDVIVIEGRLFPHHFGGLNTIRSLRAAAEAGTINTLYRFYPVVNEDGEVTPDNAQLSMNSQGAVAPQNGLAAQVVGQYVIRRVRSNESKISAAGIAHIIDFSLDLVAYGPDQFTDYSNILSALGGSGGDVANALINRR